MKKTVEEFCQSKGYYNADILRLLEIMEAFERERPDAWIKEDYERIKKRFALSNDASLINITINSNGKPVVFNHHELTENVKNKAEELVELLRLEGGLLERKTLNKAYRRSYVVAAYNALNSEHKQFETLKDLHDLFEKTGLDWINRPTRKRSAETFKKYIQSHERHLKKNPLARPVKINKT